MTPRRKRSRVEGKRKGGKEGGREEWMYISHIDDTKKRIHSGMMM